LGQPHKVWFYSPIQAEFCFGPNPKRDKFMRLPLILDKKFAQAYRDLETSPSGELKPFYRATIYNALKSTGNKTNYYFCNHLSILTAWKVEPIWKNELSESGILDYEPLPEILDNTDSFDWQTHVTQIPELDLPTFLLTFAQELLAGKTEIATAKQILEQTYHWLGGSLLGFSKDEFPPKAFFAGLAAYKALEQVTRYELFTLAWPDPFNKGLNNTDIKVENGDTAWSAAKAYGYYFAKNNWNWTGQGEPENCFEFWKWWLIEAIPQAWDLTVKDNY
jgi:hypothetical protein